MWAKRMSVVRGFARYLAGVDPRTQVPPAELISHPKRRRNPFIYTPADMQIAPTRSRKTNPDPAQGGHGGHRDRAVSARPA